MPGAVRRKKPDPGKEPIVFRHWVVCYCGNKFKAGEGDGCNCSKECSERWIAGGWFDLGAYERATLGYERQEKATTSTA